MQFLQIGFESIRLSNYGKKNFANFIVLSPACRGDEGRSLRSRHQSNVSYMRERLFEAGVDAQHTPSHIIPIHVKK